MSRQAKATLARCLESAAEDLRHGSLTDAHRTVGAISLALDMVCDLADARQQPFQPLMDWSASERATAILNACCAVLQQPIDRR